MQSQWQQYQITLDARPPGFHLITHDICQQLPALATYKTGLLHLFLQHTSASLSINENADPSVRIDLQNHLNHLIPQGQAYYLHTCEGADDMPAHIKCALIGNQLTIPINHGQLALGTWQGIYLGEHREHGGERRLLATVSGQGFT